LDITYVNNQIEANELFRFNKTLDELIQVKAEIDLLKKKLLESNQSIENHYAIEVDEEMLLRFPQTSGPAFQVIARVGSQTWVDGSAE